MSSRALLRPLCDPYPILQERAESYLAAVDLWVSRKGHGQMVRERVGVGKMAVVVGLAAKSLLPAQPTHSLATLQRRSGLSPSSYDQALLLLQPAIDDFLSRRHPGSDRGEGPSAVSHSPSTNRHAPSAASSSSQPGTPRHANLSHPGTPRTPRHVRAPNLDSPQPLTAPKAPGSGSGSGSTSGLSLAERAKMVQSGAAFGLGRSSSSGSGSIQSSPRTPHRISKLGPRGSGSFSSNANETPRRPGSILSPRKYPQAGSEASVTSTPKSVRFGRMVDTPRTVKAGGGGDSDNDEDDDFKIFGIRSASRSKRPFENDLTGTPSSSSRGSPRKRSRHRPSSTQPVPLFGQYATPEVAMILFPLALAASSSASASAPGGSASDGTPSDDNKERVDRWLSRWGEWLHSEA